SFTLGSGHKVTTNFAPASVMQGYTLAIRVTGNVTIAGTIDLAGKGGTGGSVGGTTTPTSSSAGVTGAIGGSGANSGNAGASGNNAGGNATDNLIDWFNQPSIPTLWGGGGSTNKTTTSTGPYTLNTFGIGSVHAVPRYGASSGGSGGCAASASGTAGAGGN